MAFKKFISLDIFTKKDVILISILVYCLLLVTVLLSKWQHIPAVSTQEHTAANLKNMLFIFKQITKHTMNATNIEWSRAICRCFTEL